MRVEFLHDAHGSHGWLASSMPVRGPFRQSALEVLLELLFWKSATVVFCCTMFCCSFVLFALFRGTWRIYPDTESSFQSQPRVPGPLAKRFTGCLVLPESTSFFKTGPVWWRVSASPASMGT